MAAYGQGNIRETPWTASPGTYVRSSDALNESIKLLQDAGGTSRCDEPGVLAAIRGDVQTVSDLIHRGSVNLAEKVPVP